MADDKPRYRLRLMTKDEESERAKRDSAAERAREAFRRNPKSPNSERIQSMLRHSDELRDYDIYGSSEAARKAELLSRETR